MALFRRKKKAPPDPNEFLNEAARKVLEGMSEAELATYRGLAEQLGFGEDSIPGDEVEKEKERERRARGDDRSKRPGER